MNAFCMGHKLKCKFFMYFFIERRPVNKKSSLYYYDRGFNICYRSFVYCAFYFKVKKICIYVLKSD